MTVTSLFMASLLALIHLFAGKMTFLEAIPHSRWLSLAGGVSVSSVFLLLLPELEQHQQAVREHIPFAAELSLAYFLALVGIVVFYGLEHLVTGARGDPNAPGPSTKIFWIHIGAFAFYNALIGYVLVQDTRGIREVLLLGIALGFHFVVNDHSLREHHQADYERLGRWILAVAVLTGWLVGAILPLPEYAISLFYALLAGSIILNALKEELPAEQESRFGAFALGAGLYALLLLAL